MAALKVKVLTKVKTRLMNSGSTLFSFFAIKADGNIASVICDDEQQLMKISTNTSIASTGHTIRTVDTRFFVRITSNTRVSMNIEQ